MSTDSECWNALEDRYEQLVAQNEKFATILEQLQHSLAITAPLPPTEPHTPTTTHRDFYAEAPDGATSQRTPTPLSIISHRQCVKPSPPPEFSGNRTKGRAFLNTCELYLRMVPDQFSSEENKVMWAYTFMKLGRAVLFVDRMLRFENKVGSPRYATWSEFCPAFIAEFCPKNEAQLALAKLETSGYHQGRRTVDEYIDDFRDLVDMAGYKEGLAIVVKFRRGLQRDIQDQIATLPVGGPSDSDPEAWYQAALRCSANREANAIFHAQPRMTIPPRPATFSTIPRSMITPPQPSSISTPPTKSEAPKKDRANVATNAGGDNCYRCGESGHFSKNCPRKYDVRFMTTEEHDEWMNEQALSRDAAGEDFPGREE